MTTERLPVRSLSWLTVLSILGALMGVAQTIVVATIFGATRSIEVFFAAITFQTFLIHLSSSGQIGELFVPLFHDIQVDRGEQAAREAFAAMTNTMLLIAGVVSLLGIVASLPIASILVPGFSAIDIALTAKVFAATAPLIVVHVVSGMFSTLLDAEQRYGANEVFTVVARVLNLVIILTLGWTLGIWALIVGLWVSAITQLLCQVVYIARRGYRHRLRLRTNDFHPKRVLAKVPFTFVHILSAQFFAFAMTAGLSFLPEGNFAVFSYAQRLHAKIQGIVLKPIGVVFFNRFSQSLAERANRVNEYAHHALSLSIATVSIAVVALIASGDLLLKGLWGSEKFPDDQIQLCHLVLVVFALLSIPNAQYLVTRRTNMALKLVARQYAASGLVFLASAVACYWIIPSYGIWGAMGVHVFATLGCTAVAVLLLTYTRRDLVALISLVSLVQWTVAGGVAACVVYGLRYWLQIDLSGSSLILLAQACLFGIIAVLICGFASLILRVDESLVIVSKMRRRLARQSHESARP